MNNFGHVSIVFEYDMMCAHVYRVKCFNYSNIRIRTDFYIKITIRRMRILINSFTSLTVLTKGNAGRQTKSRGLIAYPFLQISCTVCLKKIKIG